MAFFAISPRFFVRLLIGLLFVNGTRGQRSCERVPIHVDVNIQTANDTEPFLCTDGQELILRFHIQKVVNKRFDDFRRDTSVFSDILVGDACLDETVLPQTSDRRLMPFRGFNYESGVDCRLCNDDNSDSPSPSLSPSLLLPPSPAPSTTFPPSLAPSMAPSSRIVHEEIARLTVKLERQLTRKLTQKVNKNPDLCFRGSDSTVTVSIELVDDFFVATGGAGQHCAGLFF